MSQTDLALSARGVQMEYRDRTSQKALLAIESIDLDVSDGEFVSLVGPSGCGKSTFLKIVNGLLRATAGEIRLRKVQKGRENAMVFQDSALFPWYSVIDNIAYGLVCSGVSRREARKRALPFIGLVGLDGFADKYPYQLSGGMQQRANLARALAVDAAVLLMDEPFASLDAQTREVMQAELLRIWHAARKTVVFVTHQIDEAVYLADRVVVMAARPGRVLADIPIGLGRPRALAVKRTSEFQKYTEQIWQLIASQHQQAPQAEAP
ncbi:MAG TPA: ABC transporter ATP-binding protein [Candidatus Limnocylindria bacterium]|jgi:NitT/TauT family transport system ATP-binding protein|nr:ABC transporter ATP-binding protein [Candidatus Limnocylindria bacterium]